MENQNNDSLLDPVKVDTEDNFAADEKFLPDEIPSGKSGKNGKKKNVPSPDDYFDATRIEILSNEYDHDTEIVDLGDDGDTFEITREDDPMYDLYPLETKRPRDLFKEPLYDRQFGERLIDYQRFLAYASVPSAKRTVKQAWIKWQKQNGGSTKSTPSGPFRDLSNHWRWKERAYVLDLQRHKVVQQIWLNRDVERRESDWKVGHELRDKALAALDTLDADDIGPQSIAKFFALASDLQKNAIPESNLDSNDFSKLLEGLPPDRRDRIIEIVVAKARIK